MEPALLDTDIVSELLRAKNSRIVGQGRDYLRQYGNYTTSAVSVVELVQGFQKAGNTNLIDDLRVLLRSTRFFRLTKSLPSSQG
jgi:predicted nucleic acid-binding protein